MLSNQIAQLTATDNNNNLALDSHGQERSSQDLTAFRRKALVL